MKFLIIDEARRKYAMNYLAHADIRKTLEVFIRPYKKKRTVSQNNLMWMWYDLIAEHVGVSPEEMHERCKVNFLGISERVVCNELIREPISSTSLDTKQMRDFLEKVEKLGEWHNIKMPHPDDYAYAMMLSK